MAFKIDYKAKTIGVEGPRYDEFYFKPGGNLNDDQIFRLAEKMYWLGKEHKEQEIRSALGLK